VTRTGIGQDRKGQDRKGQEKIRTRAGQEKVRTENRCRQDTRDRSDKKGIGDTDIGI
jgi:hypothetical protein